MSLYAIKNDKGQWLDNKSNVAAEWTDDLVLAAKYQLQKNAEHDAERYSAKAVPLGEKPAPVVVSEEEDDMLKLAKNDRNWPASRISEFAESHRSAYERQHDHEDRLTRAYVNGWQVEKPKRWYVKVPHTSDDFYRKLDVKELDTVHGCINNANHTFTDSEITKYGLQDCVKVEVKQDVE